jgi:hypothetical protein
LRRQKARAAVLTKKPLSKRKSPKRIKFHPLERTARQAVRPVIRRQRTAAVSYGITAGVSRFLGPKFRLEHKKAFTTFGSNCVPATSSIICRARSRVLSRAVGTVRYNRVVGVRYGKIAADSGSSPAAGPSGRIARRVVPR